MVAILDGEGVVARNGAMTGQSGWVLIVADDTTERMLLFGLLERAGYHATVTDDAAGALNLLRAEPFDVVVLSLLSRSEPDAYTVLATLGRDRRLRQIPVIVISGPDAADGPARWVQLGADDWVSRPCDPVLLAARVAASVEKRRLREQEAEYLDLMDRVVEAVSVGAERFDQSALDLLTRRADAVGDLARVIQQMTAELGRARRQVTQPRDARQ
jgi:DNA-binding response OmpR family regulator